MSTLDIPESKLCNEILSLKNETSRSFNSVVGSEADGEKFNGGFFIQSERRCGKIENSSLPGEKRVKLMNGGQSLGYDLYSLIKCGGHEEKLPMSWVEIFIKAVAVTLEKFPELNATWSNGSICKSEDISVSFTVADGKASVSSTLKDACTLTALEISKQIQDSKMKHALGKSDAPSNISSQNPSFMISFLDACGITGFASPVPHPHVACLSVASPYVHLNEDMKACNLVNVTLSVNNQIVDDVAGTQFLDCLKNFLENPSLLISRRLRTSPISLENLFK
ncbi:hypothetical protein HELRODRAFT_164257 [Helobdella robusta]|uniref:2-oxoacid dehydrogenase acyltransferase catalytic domain-containing protein n=1 Tax=Helobdella robusta TaxID=6412 RepID=T1EV62_HELRO|nr:hypothetical protein HELRODRAFT_164257 [Helobdella robusta]ESN94418.1 hypothetical protein HELRODRAFT_164257 [Helobdella robusta]